MTASIEEGFGLASSSEEVALRRRLLFRLLRDFDFARPVFHGELISEPYTPGQHGRGRTPGSPEASGRRVSPTRPHPPH